MMFQSSNNDVDLVGMVAQNVSNEEDIMSISIISLYLVYDGFNHDIRAALVYKSLHDIRKLLSPATPCAIAPALLYVGKLNKHRHKTLHPTRQILKIIPPQARMWAQRTFKQLQPNLGPVANTGIRQTVSHPLSQGSPWQSILVGGSSGGHKTKLFHIDTTDLQAVMKHVADKGSSTSMYGPSK